MSDKNISRREALKKMGVFAAGAALSANGLTAASNLNLRSDKKMKVLAKYTILIHRHLMKK